MGQAAWESWLSSSSPAAFSEASDSWEAVESVEVTESSETVESSEIVEFSEIVEPSEMVESAEMAELSEACSSSPPETAASAIPVVNQASTKTVPATAAARLRFRRSLA